jgi:hypothetical protein
MQFALPIRRRLEQNRAMEDKPGSPAGLQGLVDWATTRPQAYAVYFVAVVLIGGLSFFAGTLNPKKFPASAPPPSASAPRN